MLPYPEKIDLGNEWFSQTWEIKLSHMLDENVDLDILSQEIVSNAIKAMQRTLETQGYQELIEPLDGFSVRINRLSLYVITVEFIASPGKANNDLSFITHVCEELDKLYGPITEFQGIERRRWGIFPLPGK